MVRLKCSEADQDILMECDQRRIIFQHKPPCLPRMSSIGVAVLRHDS